MYGYKTPMTSSVFDLQFKSLDVHCMSNNLEGDAEKLSKTNCSMAGRRINGMCVDV